MKTAKQDSKQTHLPKQARRVFRGVIFDVFQWPVKMYDGSTVTFEKLKRPDTAAIIPVTTDGKIILTVQQQPDTNTYLGLVGGRVDVLGENAWQAAKRELLEETGYRAKKWLLFDKFKPHSKIEWTVYTFIAKGCYKAAEQHLDGGEKIKLLPVSFEKFVKLVTADNFADINLKVKLLAARLNTRKMAAFKKLLLG